MAALVGRSLLNAPEAEAANGDAVKAGQSVTATNLTKVTNTADTGAGLWGVANGQTRHGIFGSNTGGGHGAGGMADSAGAAGVHGVNDSDEGIGVWGEAKSNGSGVYGTNPSSNGAGVQGFASGPGGVGVYGNSSQYVGVLGATFGGPKGVGVLGRTLAAGGVAIVADSYNQDGANAFVAYGPTVFSRSGLATIPRGAKSVTVTQVSLTATSLVLATVQAAAKQYVQSAVPDVAGSQFVIKLNAAATTDLPVGWFIVN
jgi:hypothetical protein